MKGASVNHLPPQNLNAEEAVLGAMLWSPKAIAAAGEVGLRTEDFYKPQHQDIHDAILRLHQAGQPVDTMTVTTQLRQDGTLDKVGGPVALTAMYEYTPSVANAKFVAAEVVDMARLRKLTDIGHELASLGYTAGNGALPQNCETVDDVLAIAHSVAASMSSFVDRGGKGFTRLEDAFTRVYDDLADRAQTKRAAGLSTGYPELDRITNGLEPGQLIVIGARPAMGKSAFAQNIGQNVAVTSGKAVAIFSMEMEADEIATRALSGLSGVASSRMQRADLHTADWQKLTDAATRFTDHAPGRIFVDESTTSNPAQIAARCRRLVSELALRHVQLGLVIVDYLQLMDPDRRNDSKNVEVGDISKALKRLAKELGVPIIAVAQLNRAVEMRPDKRPKLSDLRDSGSVEQDASKVLFLYRPEYYLGEDTPPEMQGLCEVIVDKNRNGETGACWLRFEPTFVRFTNKSGGAAA